MSNRIPSSDKEFTVLGWCREAIEEGEAFLKAQRGYSKISDSIDAIMSDRVDIRVSSLSSTTSNHFGKNAEDLAAYMTDIRPFWEFKTWNKKYDQQAEIFNKLSLHWWLMGGVAKMGAQLNFLDVVKYSLVGATGWAHLPYNDKWGDVTLEAEDPRDVLPIRPSSFHTIQDALGVCVRRERTVNYIRSMTCFKGKESKIEATRDGSVSASLTDTRAGKLLEWLGSPFRQRLFSNRAARDIPRIPVTDLYTLYLNDESRNESSALKFMGEWHMKPVPTCIECIAQCPHPLTNWSYIVGKGELLYPNKRLIIFTESVIGYDGPSPYWHGLFPLAKLTLNPYPWTWLGKAIMWDQLPLQKSLDRTLRTVDDYMEKVARPDIKADKNSMSKAALDRIDTRRAGGKFLLNPLAGKGFELVYPNPLPGEVQKFIEFCISEMGVLSGVNDLSQLSKLNQMPEADTVDKLTSAMTAGIRLRSKVIESFMREFAQMLAFDFAQFYTMPMRLAMLGEKGITFEDFDTDPKSAIPDYVHNEDFDAVTGVPSMQALQRGPRPRHERAKAFMQQITYNVSPSSLLNSSAVEQKLLYLQLARAGWMDIWSLFEKLDIPNGGMPPDGANTIIDRLKAMGDLGLGMNANPAGRKASGQQMPRTTIKES